MYKRLHIGDFSGFNVLVMFIYLILKQSTKIFKISLIKFVFLYLIAIAFQTAALMVFYLSLKHYVSTDLKNIYIIEKITQFLDLTKVESLLLSLLPAILLLLLSSSLLKYCRVGLSSLAISMKDNLVKKIENENLIYKDDKYDNFLKQIEGTFGAVRAFFLNTFVFFQATIALIALLILEPIIGFTSVVMFVVFLYSLSFIKVSKNDKKENDINELDILDENIGLSSKSFERLEKLRVYGRNFGNVGLIIFVLVGIIFSLDFMITLEQFTLVMILVRVSVQIYVPVGVISASCVPYKKNISTLYNIMNLNDLFSRFKVSLKETSAITHLLITKSSTNKEELRLLELSGNKTVEGVDGEVNFVTYLFEDKKPIKISDLNKIISKLKKVGNNDKLLFFV